MARGEGQAAMVKRIRKVINNPVRAEMIAQTEAVNAYQSGLMNFGIDRRIGIVQRTHGLSSRLAEAVAVGGWTHGEGYSLRAGRRVKLGWHLHMDVYDGCSSTHRLF
ncbi:hypothetical protein [Mycobacterium sp. SMC-4]|jgi:hypothetical protein|uniref:hypothetical protein n=1 Tax=Mycobacterium sp. SMC-4 TaxID=2857059 RepID=UPI001F24AFBC|nr:hypothetical protein [Mycobacterium sp. SMC-4]MCF6389994.1 hypothetical protein [Mycobacterium sp. MBM]UXA21279.1 hypothetical protein KXD98_27665 [Mycobacterium sp. SMC-4]